MIFLLFKNLLKDRSLIYFNFNIISSSGYSHLSSGPCQMPEWIITRTSPSSSLHWSTVLYHHHNLTDVWCLWIKINKIQSVDVRAPFSSSSSRSLSQSVSPFRRPMCSQYLWFRCGFCCDSILFSAAGGGYWGVAPTSAMRIQLIITICSNVTVLRMAAGGLASHLTDWLINWIQQPFSPTLLQTALP